MCSDMARIGMGLIGAGFVGPHHIDAVRRLGYVDIVAGQPIRRTTDSIYGVPLT